MNETKRIFKSYSGDVIVPIGLVKVRILFFEKDYDLLLYVLPGNSKPILGRDWLEVLGIIKNFECKMNEIKTINECESRFAEIVKEFGNVFNDELGTYNKRTFKLELKPNAVPKFCKPHPVPYALREKVEMEIDRLIKSGVAEKVESSEWATPRVPILKSNGQVRICGNYKITVNRYLIVNRHPIPRTQDLLAMLKGGTIFTKLDLMNAYQQFLLDEESQKLTTINTHKGLLKYKRLVFGVAIAPGIFQGEIEEMLKGIPGVLKFFDDILIIGKNVQEYDTRLREVLLRFSDAGLTVRKSKCIFAKPKVDFLGHTIDAEGIHVSDKKVQAIRKVEPPNNVKELQVFLGMMNYHSKFIQNYSFIVSPLYRLLRQDVRWKWTEECHQAFEQAKAKLSSYQVLVHYDTQLPVKVTCDASPVGVGAVLSHIFHDGSTKPIAFASRSLSPTERNYSQLDKEALALVFGVRTFHQYLYGRHFILETDHKPLIYIFGNKKGLPAMAANRVQRWSLILAGYDYEIRYIKGVENESADFLSRFPIQNNSNNETEEYSYLNYFNEGVRTFSLDSIRSETDKDLILNLVKKYLLHGWPKNVHDRLLPYKRKEQELTLKIVVLCGVIVATNQPKTSLHVWSWPESANQRLHADFCGPIDGKMFIVILDSHSKWIDIRELNNIITETTIDVFRDYFATWGIPNTLVTDNGPTFTSKLFEEFMISYGVSHKKTALYHPAKCSSRKEALAKYLFHYRSSPHCTTDVSPAELQIGRKFRTRWDLLKEKVKNNVYHKQQEQRKYFRGNRNVTFDEKEVVMARDYANGNWRKVKVDKQVSPVTYNVTTDDQRVWKRHVDQLRACNLSVSDSHNLRTPEKCNSPIANVTQNDLNDREKLIVCESNLERAASGDQSQIIENACSPKSNITIPSNRVLESSTNVTEPTILRRSTRVVKARKVLDL
ncbi:uncharacterized protein K02A2.6-like [Phymastichus coffea]|uniref:uncharacterized protein K02A2.6-like n=1 Tax=Phymastichus coffea TaxID=108790 RepID=UPI00273BF7D5|nr:uncharacterized protein K02A2.6-like [Phymastichus coffea]